jgi:DNA-binding NarL/FixJ family response regulator
MRRLKLLIAEDHPLMVEALRLAASVDGGFEVVGAVASGAEVVDAAKRLEPDVILLDLRLPEVDGLEALQELRAEGIRARCVVLSALDGDEVVQRALRAGACAFIAKRIDPRDLPAALRQALDQTLFQPVAALGSAAAEDTGVLTERELAVLRAVADGLSNKEIAQRLSYAEQTVKLDLTHVYRKLGVSSRSEAAFVALSRGLLEAAAPMPNGR